MTRSFQVVFLVLAMAGAAAAQQKGDAPPALVWDKLKGSCPADLDWKSLQGKVVVVSIGADDVFPQDIVGWNEVPQALHGEPVVVLQVVSGSEFLLDQALAMTPSLGCILLDSQDANRKNFKLPRVLRTVIVDQAGYVAGYPIGGHEEGAIRAVLNHVIDGELPEAPHQPEPFNSTAGLDQSVSYEVHIAPAGPRDLRVWGEERPDVYMLRNQSLKLAILDLWGTPLARIFFPANLDSRNYNISARIPMPDRPLLLKLVRGAVERQVGLRVETELRTQRVYVLTGPKSTSSHLKLADKDERWITGGGEGSIIGTSQTMQEIARILENLLDLPVLDETGLQGKYDYSASSHLHEPEATLDLADQLGLELTPADRPIQMLVVRKVN